MLVFVDPTVCGAIMKAVSADLTVGDLVERGVEDVDAFCVGCGNMWQSPITVLPDATTLSKVASLMKCPACGGRDIEVVPASCKGLVH